MVVRNQKKQSIMLGVDHKLVLKTKEPHRVMEKYESGLYWLKCLDFWKSIGSPGRKVNKSANETEKIPSNMVLHKHTYG